MNNNYVVDVVSFVRVLCAKFQRRAIRDTLEKEPAMCTERGVVNASVCRSQ